MTISVRSPTRASFSEGSAPTRSRSSPPPRYLTKRGKPKWPEDLVSHDGLLTAPDRASLTLSHETQGATVVAPIVRYFADETRLLLAAAKAGLGVTAIPRRLCRADVVTGALVRVLPKWTGQVTTTILVPPRHADLPAVRPLGRARDASRPGRGRLTCA